MGSLIEFIDTARFINLVLAVSLFSFAIVGVVYMRGREVYEGSGKYALWGLVFLTGGGLVSAIAVIIPGDQYALTYAALAIRVTAFIFLATHIIFNIRKEHRA
jgi:hypothetical protein